MNRAQARQRAHDLAALGRRLFFDPKLSVSGKQSCASCHDPRFAYGPPNELAVQSGGKNMGRPGYRAVPSLRYLQAVPQFSEHYFDSDATGEDSVDNGPTGGLTWDGRVDRARDQARIPLLSPFEMANDSTAQVVDAALLGDYASELKRISQGDLFATIGEALETFEQDETEFYPYSSKYDAWLAGKVQLTDREQLGLRLFVDPDKGDCGRCHPATRGENGTPPQFTDYGFAALGVPRNPKILANQDLGWYDLGLCGPERQDLRDRVEYCGKFRTPSLRNVAVRRVFFHNGAIHSLREAVEFYVNRKDRFDDLPAMYWKNVETGHPFSSSRPSLSDSEIDAVVAFLKTLTDRD